MTKWKAIFKEILKNFDESKKYESIELTLNWSNHDADSAKKEHEHKMTR